MKKFTYDFRLTDIIRYSDVEEGLLRLTVGNRTKSWKAIWQTRIYMGCSGLKPIPRGFITLRYMNHNQWIDCPRLKMNLRNHVWIEPLNAENWIDLGTNIYLMSNEGWPNALPYKDFEKMTIMLNEYDVKLLFVEAPIKTKTEYRLDHDLFSPFNWDEEA